MQNKDKKAATAQTGESAPSKDTKEGTLGGETTTNVAISKKSKFNQTIIIPAAIDALFGMTPAERFEEVKCACERNEVEALNTYVAPLTHWMNDLDYVLDNYAEVVEALEEHFNKPGRPEMGRATWGDLAFDDETVKYIDKKFGYKPETSISWGGICHVFFNRSIRTMQRRKAFQSMLTSGETVISPRKERGKSSGPGGAASDKKSTDDADYTEAKNLALLAVKWASENPDNDNAQAIMKIAADRANRLAQNGPQLLKPVAKAVTTPVPRAMPTEAADQLREALGNEPDRDVASRLLTEHLQNYASQFSNGRIKIKEVIAKIEFIGRDERILPGDWLEKKEKDAAPTLCTCVGTAEFMKRRKVQEWSDGRWQKEHVIFSSNEGDYRVVTEATARHLAPEAFPSPTTPEGL
jgi:hypothetical protein